MSKKSKKNIPYPGLSYIEDMSQKPTNNCDKKIKLREYTPEESTQLINSKGK